MNRIYRLIWNRERRMLVVCSELASARRGLAGPVGRERELRCVLAALFVGLSFALHVDTASATVDTRMSDMLALADKYAPQPVAVAASAAGRVDAGAAGSAGVSLAAAASAPVHAPPSMKADAAVASRVPPSVVPAAREALVAIAQTPRAVVRQASAATPRMQAAVETRVDTGAALARVLPEAATSVTARLAAGTAVAMNEAPRAPAPLPVHAAPVALLAREEGLGLELDIALDVDAGLDVRTGDHALTLGTAAEATAAIGSGDPDAPEDGAEVDLAVFAQRETAHGRGLIGGVVGGIGGVVDNVVGPVVGGVGNVVGGVVNGVVAPVVGGVVGGVGNVVGGIFDPVEPQAIPPSNPKFPRPYEPNTGLVIGTGGLVGGVGQLVGPTGASLFGGDGFVRNGNLAVNSANVMQAYAVTNVLGLPVANVTPVGTLLGSLGNASTGGSSHLTLIGGVTSDSYIQNINNGAAGGLLGLVLPDRAPGWASRCANLLGLVSTDCWAVNPAQDFQVLVGDGAYANGSKEVVIGANARHELPRVDASIAFPGNGLNDPLDPTGVPTSDYNARLGHSVVVGDSALGTAHAQTILGSEATSSQVNSVALGYRSAANRGPQTGYTAYGLTAAQNAAGEVSIGRAGQERQLTHLAAGSADTDAVNVAQLRGAIELIDTVEVFAVRYDEIGGVPDFTRVTFGNGTGPTTLANVAAGAVAAGSSEAVTGAQLHGANLALAGYLGAGAGLDAAGNVTAPDYALTEVGPGGTLGSGNYADVGGAFGSVSSSLANVAQVAGELDRLAVRYDVDVDGNLVNRVTLTGTGSGAPVGLGNVAAGAVTAVSADAVNGAQLYGANLALAGYLGAGAGLDAAGNVTAPDYLLNEVGADGTLGSGNYSDVGSAFGSVSTSLANVTQIAGELDRLAVRYDVDVDGNLINRVTLTGDGSGAPVGLGNVAAGAVTAVSADAVTGAQLYGANLALAGYLGAGAGLDAAGNVTAPDYVLNEVGVDGTLGSGNYADVGGAFGSVSTSLANVTQITGELDRLAVRYDVDADGELVNRVTLTGDGSGAPVALDNVAAGALTAISAEAVTGAQLYGANLALAGYLGGGAGLDAAGNVTAPTYVLNEVAADGSLGSGSYADVGGAFDSVSASLANVTQAAGELDRLAVRYDVDADGEILNRVTLVGDNTGTPVVVDNVAAAAVTATSAEAVTGAQLYGANVALAGYLGGGASLDADGNVTAPTYVLNEVAVDGSLGSGSYVDVGSAFGSVSASLANVTQTAGELDRRAVRYDIDADGEIVNRVTLTGDGSGAPVALDNVAAGALTAISAEAVTGAQLYGANLVLAGYLGGGASLDADGNVTMPTYVLNEITSTGGTTTGSYTDVGGALDSLSQSLINIDGRTDAVGRLAVRYDADADGNPLNQVTLLGDGTGAPVRLTQLADGAITAISTDAVSGGQLFATHTTLAGFFGGTTGFDGDTGQWSAPVFSITSVALDGGVSATDYANVTDAFAAVDASLVNLNQRIDQGGGPGTGSPYVQVNSTQGAASAVGAESVAIGPQARAEGDGSVALGDGAVAVADNSIALGAGSRAETGAQQGYDGAFVEAGSSNSVGEVSVGSTGAERKITHVADGSDRYDAVNVGQLQGGVDYAIDQSRQYTDQQINNINNGGSGMFRVNDTLDRGNPSASGDDSVAGGAGAVASGGSSTALGNGARAEGANSVALGAGSVATRDNTVSVGSAGNERQITHVADASDAHDAVNLRQLQASEQGSLRYDTRSDGSSDFSSVTLGAPGGSAPVRVRNVAAGVAGTDAVNLNQLNQAMDWSRQYTDDRFDAVQGDIRRIDNRASAGVAAAMAMASLPQPYLPGRSMISVAGGSFNGESSMAVGIAGVSEGGRWIYRLNGSANSRGDGGVSVGAGFQW